MREVLFRGKRLDNGEWVEGNLFIPDKKDTPTQICIGTYIVRISYGVDPETIGQFTGLYDRNARKIWEGDVVITKYGRLCIVDWFSSQATNGWDLKTVLTPDNVAYTNPPTAFDLYKKDNLEVIGNIHDNPELLR